VVLAVGVPVFSVGKDLPGAPSNGPLRRVSSPPETRRLWTYCVPRLRGWLYGSISARIPSSMACSSSEPLPVRSGNCHGEHRTCLFVSYGSAGHSSRVLPV